MEDAGKLLLRVTVGGLLLLHGIHKLTHGIGGIISTVEGHGLPSFVAYGVYVGEVVAPAFVIAGFKTRLAALVLAFNMVVAIFLSHRGEVFTIGGQGEWAIELQMLYLLGGVSIALLGAGAYSLSRGRGRFD